LPTYSGAYVSSVERRGKAELKDLQRQMSADQANLEKENEAIAHPSLQEVLIV